jgi:cytochrome c peroxidase
VPYFIAPGRVDPGRQGGIKLLKDSPYTLAGRFNDDPNRAAWGARYVAELHTNFGAFKVPSLRNLTRTAPYMHAGSRPTLVDVVRHYSELNPERLHTDGEKILEPLYLSQSEIDSLVAFLTTLSE